MDHRPVDRGGTSTGTACMREVHSVLVRDGFSGRIATFRVLSRELVCPPRRNYCIIMFFYYYRRTNRYRARLDRLLSDGGAGCNSPDEHAHRDYRRTSSFSPRGTETQRRKTSVETAGWLRQSLSVPTTPGRLGGIRATRRSLAIIRSILPARKPLSVLQPPRERQGRRWAPGTPSPFDSGLSSWTVSVVSFRHRFAG